MKPIEVITERYSQASGMTDRYVQGVETTTKNWQGETLKAEAAWKQGTAEAAAKGLFRKGVSRVTNEEWRSKAAGLGGERYSGGITAGLEKYAREVQPFLNVLKGITLKPRGPRGAAQNYERVKQIGTALNAARLARG